MKNHRVRDMQHSQTNNSQKLSHSLPFPGTCERRKRVVIHSPEFWGRVFLRCLDTHRVWGSTSQLHPAEAALWRQSEQQPGPRGNLQRVQNSLWGRRHERDEGDLPLGFDQPDIYKTSLGSRVQVPPKQGVLHVPITTSQVWTVINTDAEQEQGISLVQPRRKRSYRGTPSKGERMHITSVRKSISPPALSTGTGTVFLLLPSILIPVWCPGSVSRCS